MPPSSLWLFAHRALAPEFHDDPHRFVDTLDGRSAPAFLEHMWSWALRQNMTSAGATEPAKPPLGYDLERPRPGLAIVRMWFRDVRVTGEPWHLRFFVRDPDPGATNGYTRMFLLEHSEYASELAGTPQALVCESERGGNHRNWGVALAPTDEPGFDAFVIETLRGNTTPAASWSPGS